MYSGAWWWRWLRVGAQSKMWPLLGWFSGLMCVGSVAGMVAWCAASQSNSNYYQAFTSSTRQQYYIVIGACDRWLAVFGVPYGLEFLCLVIPKLLLLGRLMSDAARSLKQPVRRTLHPVYFCNIMCMGLS